MEIDYILSRLDGVKRHGVQYMAKCPAHEDKSPSLSLKDCGDRVLVHCFGGCETNDVLSAIGLAPSDLYADSGLSNCERRRYYEEKRRSENRTTLEREKTVLMIAKNQLKQGISLKPVDVIRVNEAYATIKKIKGALVC